MRSSGRVSPALFLSAALLAPLAAPPGCGGSGETRVLYDDDGEGDHADDGYLDDGYVDEGGSYDPGPGYDGGYDGGYDDGFDDGGDYEDDFDDYTDDEF